MNRHTPVLLEQVEVLLRPKMGEKFVDITAGYGGHATKLLALVGKSGYGYLFDKDPEAIKFLRSKFKNVKNISIDHVDFSAIEWQKNIPLVDMILADIGVSSPQIDQPERGFSFSRPGPLDMRMDTTQNLTAEEIVNSYSEQDLAEILYKYGEERASRRIAKAIVEARKIRPITNTTDLAEIISKNVRAIGKIHPATRSFQALRIAVNDELVALEQMLKQAPGNLKIGGRMAVISFHSLEDRLVKQAFKKLATPIRDDFGQIVSEAKYKIVTKKPVIGSKLDNTNPRARSAKLRVVEKIK